MIELIRATIDDIPTIRALAAEIWNEHYISIITQEQIDYMLKEWYNETTLARQMAEQGHFLWLIRNNHQTSPVGFIAISKQTEFGAYYLNKFYINKNTRGIGSQILKQVIAKFPDISQLRLNVNRRNFKSVNFYFKMGFKIESCYELQVGDRFVMDDFIMVWKKNRLVEETSTTSM
jgi:diamine N-acetyltransferase